MSKPVPASIPVFKLYGETRAWPTPDLMHFESIPERSRLHDWEIKPHRHVDLMQVLYVKAGSAVLKVEEKVVHVNEPTLQIVPALSVHTFKFSEDIEGHILTLAQPLVHSLVGALDGAEFSQPLCHEAGNDALYLDMLFSTIGAEYRQRCQGRELALHSLVSLLLVWISRRNAAPLTDEAIATERGIEHLHAFVALLESGYREHWPISRYASRLGLSANHLNSLCRRFSGQSALQIINERLYLEARRCLVYTEMTVNQISDSLGFSEPAYFSRFFKRACGVSPKTFRASR